ncbi:MAG: NAD+ synthase [Simkaniaceae bacterium]|nr:NAD+ synthase [Simkaniaceae bacterium]
MRILMAQLNPIIGDLDGNTRKIIETLDIARERRTQIVLFPELTICGYPPEDLVFHESFIDSIEQHLEQIIKASSGLGVFVGLPRRNFDKGEKHLLNSAAVIYDGNLLGFQDKWLLPNYDVFNERRYFSAGYKTRTWEMFGKKIGCVICEDIWQNAGYVTDVRYAEDPIKALVEHEPDLLVNLTASPYQYQKPHIRVKVCRKAAQTLGCPVLLCCQVGADDQIIFDGYSVCVDEKGNLRQLGKGFKEDLMTIDTDAPACPVPFEYCQEKDLFEALKLGVADYCRKSGFSKAIFGLSGGIDSALVAAIAAEALGPENVIGVSMPSPYSSKASVDDAKQLAENLGIELKIIPIENEFKSYNETLSPYFKNMPDDVTEENLQARIRGNILMAFSNKFGHLVLSTGNKSELALGYCTLYGDMAGGLGVIADVKKTTVYDMCRWLNQKKEIIPQNIIDKPPSAELRPNQKDLDSLPEYGIVDAVLQGYVENYQSIKEIAQESEIPLELVMNLVRKIHAAEYKRRQGPPALRITKKSFGVGRQYPIVQGWL